MALRDRLEQLQESISERTGYAVAPRERLEVLEARSTELGATKRELDALAWTALDYVGGAPQEMKAVERRKLAQRSRVIWMRDPQAGAMVDLMNDFVFGRGIPQPKANDPEVQKIIDEAWDDPDNQLVLTSWQAQLSLGTDLTLQSNVFVLVFDDGEDGKVKLGLLDHDSVENVVRDPDNRLRVLYYVSRHYKQEWDYKHDGPKNDMRARGPADANKGDKGKGELRYYAHWRNVEDAESDAEAGLRTKPEGPPATKMGDGRVFHIAINRGSEMAFGHPVMDRLERWFSSYNSFLDARLDIIQAKAAFVMKRKVKGTPGQLQKMAQQAVSRRSVIGAAVPDDPQAGPNPAGILNENDSVEHEAMNMDTAAGNALQDGQMIRSQTSAATRFPQSYYGDASSANLATATSLELPVLKTVESRQEFVESLVRFFVDRVVERAVDTGRLSGTVEAEDDTTAGSTNLAEDHEDKVADEEAVQRDLGYEFSMPSPLRRMMGDLVGAIMNIARTFDPNNTNPELSRTLLNVALGEGLELENPADAVERIFPEGYVDPAVAAAQAPPEGPPEGATEFGTEFGEFGPQGTVGADGRTNPDPANPYGAPMKSVPPEKSMQQAAVTLGRNGEPVTWLREARAMREGPVQAALAARRQALEAEHDETVGGALPDGASHNGNGNGNGTKGTP